MTKVSKLEWIWVPLGKVSQSQSRDLGDNVPVSVLRPWWQCPSVRLETSVTMSQCQSRDLGDNVPVSVSRPWWQCPGLGLQIFKKGLDHDIERELILPTFNLMYSAHFVLAEGKQTRLSSTKKDLKSTVSQQIPLLMKLSNVLMRKSHEECIVVSKKRLLLVQKTQKVTQSYMKPCTSTFHIQKNIAETWCLPSKVPFPMGGSYTSQWARRCPPKNYPFPWGNLCLHSIHSSFSLHQRWANFFYEGPHWKFYCCRRATYIYFVCLNCNFQCMKIWINDNNHVFCQENLHTIWPQISIKINETNVTVHSFG